MRTGGWLCGLVILATARVTTAVDLELTLPPVIHGVAGQPVNVYFDNLVLTPTPEDFKFEVTCALGASDATHWTAVPAMPGQHPWRVVVRDAAGREQAVAQTLLQVAPADAGAGQKVTLLLVGDSLTHASHYANELARLLSGPGNPEWRMIGTHRPASAQPNVAHEGYGGWKWADFLTKHDPKPQGATAGPPARKSTSPFLFPTDSGRVEFSLSRYFGETNGGVPPDVVTFLLGINDCFGANPENPDAKIDEVLDEAEKLLGEFRKASPQAVLAVGLTTPPNARESGFEANYKGRYTRWGWKRIQHRLVRRMLERLGGRENEGIHLVATETGLDPVAGYPDNNGVHPNPAGYAQVGGMFYAWLKNWLARQP